MPYTLDSSLYHTFGDQIYFWGTDVHSLPHTDTHLSYFFLHIAIVINLLQSAYSLQRIALMERYETTNYRCKRPSHTLSSYIYHLNSYHPMRIWFLTLYKHKLIISLFSHNCSRMFSYSFD